MKKLLLLISFVALLGFNTMRAESETVTVDFTDRLPSGWVLTNCYDDPMYVGVFGGLNVKSKGSIEFPELTKLQSLVFEARFTFIELQYLNGSQWEVLQDFTGSGTFKETTVALPDWVKNGSVKLRFYVENGGSTVFKTLTYTTGDAAPTPSLLPAGIKFTLNNQEVTGNVEVTYGETPYKLPTLTFSTTADITIYSSDESVATTVNRDVVVMGPGTAVITAFAPENEYYEAGEASYTLIVNEKGEVELLPAGLKFMMGSEEVTGDLEVNMKEAFELPVLVKDTDATAVITSSDETVATITSRGLVSVVGEGTTVIKATTPETATYEAGEASYTLIVIEGTGVEGIDAEMAIVKVANGCIEVPAGAQIFSVAGVRVNGENVAAGVYVVRLANGKTVKVMVK